MKVFKFVCHPRALPAVVLTKAGRRGSRTYFDVSIHCSINLLIKYLGILQGLI
ncbi:MAG: hypothetical protein NUV87_03935 [Candidatus Roizmanbacteria bacterium]|nr:hypothetical protein [Candidatus Roizmanbacteria bacterium]